MSTHSRLFGEPDTPSKHTSKSTQSFYPGIRMPDGASARINPTGTGQKPVVDTNLGGGTNTSYTKNDQDNFSTSTHSWPIFFAILPPVVSVFHGDARAWSDLMLLALVGFYLFLVIKVPWELYFSARKRRINQIDQINQPGNASQEALRSEAIRKLRRQENLSLLLVLVSPGLGGYLLQVSRQFLSDYDKYFSQLNIMIFIFAAGIKPVSYMIGLANNRALRLQEEIHHPNSEMEILRDRTALLESELCQLRTALATKSEVVELKQGMQPALIELTKWFQKFELREQTLKKRQETKLHELEMRLNRIEICIRRTNETNNLKSKGALAWLVEIISRIIWLPLNIFLFCLRCFNYLIPYRLLQYTGHLPLETGPVDRRKANIIGPISTEDREY